MDVTIEGDAVAVRPVVSPELGAVAELAQAAKAARVVADAAQADYVEAVKRAMDAGMSVPAIAQAAGVERTSVYKALRRRAAAERAAVDREPLTWPRDIGDYRAARDTELRAQEQRTGGYAGDIELERARGVKQPITYREWLSGRGGERRVGHVGGAA